MLPKVNSCCCGCSLRTGTLILGWLGAIGGALGVLNDSLIVGTEYDEFPGLTAYALTISVLALVFK